MKWPPLCEMSAMLVVGLGEAVDQEEIAAIATDLSFIYNVTSVETVNGVAQSINNMTCHVCK